MVLTLKASGTAIRIESALPAFDAILERAVAAARAEGLRLGPATEDNLAALGHAPATPRALDPSHDAGPRSSV